jgi:hypothetical protein
VKLRFVSDDPSIPGYIFWGSVYRLPEFDSSHSTAQNRRDLDEHVRSLNEHLARWKRRVRLKKPK